MVAENGFIKYEKLLVTTRLISAHVRRG